MTLFWATFIVGLLLVLIGIVPLLLATPFENACKGMLRSKAAAVILLGLATAWFCIEISQLGEPDFGNHKNKLFWGFIIVSFLSYFYVPDFLSVRGLAALLLLSSDAVLDAAYMEPPLSRLFLVGFTYLVIVISMYLGSLPYRLRDFFDWLFKASWKPRLLAIILLGYGLFLVGISFSYPSV